MCVSPAANLHTVSKTTAKTRTERDTRIASAKSGEINQERVAAKAAKHITVRRDKTHWTRRQKQFPDAPAFRTHCDDYRDDHLRGRGERGHRQGIRVLLNCSVREKNPVQTKGSTDNVRVCVCWEQKWKNKQIKRLKCQQRRRIREKVAKGT